MIDLLPRDIERFWSKVDKSGECWTWTAARTKGQCGYGVFGVTRGTYKKTTGAHRVSYFLTYGDIPRGHLVLHKCDNPPCVKPEHLWAGTQSDNINDAVAKGRHVVNRIQGERSPFSKLTDKIVLAAREANANGTSIAELARRYHVASPVMWHAVRGSKWKHLNQ